jgi:hypothetical protein
LCTKPKNEDKAEQYFCNFYKELGFSKPKKIIWFNNPIEMFCQSINWNQAANHVWEQIWDQASNQVLIKVRNQVGSRIRNRVVNRVNNLAWNQVWDQINNYVSDQVRNQVRNYGWNQVRNRLWGQVFYGQHDAFWLAYYSYMMQVLRVEAPKLFASFMLLAQEITWWFSSEQTVFITRKPKECIVEDGKVVKLVYQDNYTIT